MVEYYYFIYKVIISWYSKKQRIILILTIKAKYIVFRYII